MELFRVPYFLWHFILRDIILLQDLQTNLEFFIFCMTDLRSIKKSNKSMSPMLNSPMEGNLLSLLVRNKIMLKEINTNLLSIIPTPWNLWPHLNIMDRKSMKLSGAPEMNLLWLLGRMEYFMNGRPLMKVNGPEQKEILKLIHHFTLLLLMINQMESFSPEGLRIKAGLLLKNIKISPRMGKNLHPCRPKESIHISPI